MKRASSTTKEEQSLDVLKRIAKRVEDTTVDIHEMKRDLKFMKFGLHAVESNTEITKVDVEKLREELEKVTRSTDDITETTREILERMVTQEELKGVSDRVTTLEQQ